MKTVLFIDTVCPKPYDLNTFQTEGLGGTEATVVRIAEGLAATGLFNVVVKQHNRVEWSFHGAAYVSSYDMSRFLGGPDYVIVLRDPRTLLEAKNRFPKAKHYLWTHDLPAPALGRSIEILNESNGVLCVSNWHRVQTIEMLKTSGYDGRFPVQVVYNPIEDDLKPSGEPYDKNSLAFVSSPHKGLTRTLELFRALLRFNPDFTLYVANPGYFLQEEQKQDRVVYLGTLSYSKVIETLQKSLCLFFPNTSFPETFGRVLAESNAVGTPALTHGIGATWEVCDRPDQEIVDCRDPKAVVDRIMAWHGGERPTVRGKKEFRLSNVVRSWIDRVLK